MEIIFIRHGNTLGNEKKVYLGLTDEPLSQLGFDVIKKNAAENIYPKCEHIYTSPLKRCIETTEIIYPNQKYSIIKNLTECDFGEYEYKSYNDLKYFTEYQNWIDSGGMAAFPNGESGANFRKRSIKAFEQIIENAKTNNYNKIAVVCHGGNIMSILEAFEESKKSFYDWQIKNGQGFLTQFESNNLKIIKKLI